MKNLLVLIFLMLMIQSSFGGERLDFGKLLERGFVRYEENRILKLSTSGGKKYSGPLFCSDHILSGHSGGYKKEECLKGGSQAEYWFDLQAGEFVNSKELNFGKSRVDSVRKFSAYIEFFNSVAVISFDGVVANSYALTSFLNMNDQIGVDWVSVPYYCSSNRLLVGDVIENNREKFKLSGSESRNMDLIDVIYDPDFPYLLKYIDDDEVWGMGGSVSNSGESIYIFIGDKQLKIISEVAFGLCSPNGSFVKLLKENINKGFILQFGLIRN
jgi:hypothetical protein